MFQLMILIDGHNTHIYSEGNNKSCVIIISKSEYTCYYGGQYFVFCIGFNVPFNTFQAISGRCLLVTEGMIASL